MRISDWSSDVCSSDLTIALRGRGAKLGIIGRGLTTLDPIIRDVARAQGRELLDDSSVQQYFRRSDHFALVKRGVPMVMLTGIFSREREKDDAIDRYFERDYHQAGDELEAVPSFDGDRKSTRLNSSH